MTLKYLAIYQNQIKPKKHTKQIPKRTYKITVKNATLLKTYSIDFTNKIKIHNGKSLNFLLD